MPTIQLEALDTLFFRDGKPFSMGEDTFAEGAFPPSPSVIYGALRTAYIAQNLGVNGQTIDDLIADTEGLVINDIRFEIGTSKYYPMPLDYAEIKDDDNKGTCLKLFDNSMKLTSATTPYLCMAEEHVEQVNDGLFSNNQMKNYLNGVNRDVEITKWSSEISIEPKFGNSRNNETRSTSDDDGNVYRVGMRRLAKNNKDDIKFLRIIIDYTLLNLAFDKNNLIRVGGEGKAMITQPYNSAENENIVARSFQENEKFFKIYLSTPAMFENSLKPKFINDLNSKGYEIELLAAAVGKPLKFGGWDVKAREPKPMLQIVPSGSVYYYKINNPDKSVNDLLNDLTEKSISESKQKEGFGLFKIANLKFQENLL